MLQKYYFQNNYCNSVYVCVDLPAMWPAIHENFISHCNGTSVNIFGHEICGPEVLLNGIIPINHHHIYKAEWIMPHG